MQRGKGYGVGRVGLMGGTLAALAVAVAVGCGSSARVVSAEGAVQAQAGGGARAGIVPLAPLPPVPVPADNPQTAAKIELGKMLFFDPRLAGDNSTSCAKCHDPDKGFSSGTELSPAYPGTKHWRHAPTVLNAAYLKQLFWDGREHTLEGQAVGPVQAPIEMNQHPVLLEEELKQVPWYVEKFKEVFDSEVDFQNMAKAISAFERTIISRNVPFDRYLKGDQSALSAEQKRGLTLFKGKAKCMQCHHGPLLTDQSLHATGVPETEPLRTEPDRIATRRFFVRGTGYKDYRSVNADYGLEFITKLRSDRFKFKTPSLREIAETAPYMHNGALETLEDVIDFYDAGGGTLPNKSSKLSRLGLTESEKEDLIAFLESLTGDKLDVTPPAELPKKSDGSL